MATFKSYLISFIEKGLTPIIVTAVGVWLNSSFNETQKEISKLQTEMQLKIAPIKEMKPYMEMLSDTSVTKNILGAYSIYMLKKDDDSRIAAQMISAMQKDYLVDVLRTLGKDDDSVQAVLDELGSNKYDLTPLEYAQFDKKTRDTLNLTSMQKYALKVKGTIEQNKLREQEFVVTSDLTSLDELSKEKDNIIINNKPDGWIYLGESNNLIVNLPKGELLQNIIYKLNSATNLRAGRPNKTNHYKLPKKIKVVSKGTEVKIDSFTKEKRHYWAQVKVILKVDVLVNNLFSPDKETRTTAAQDIVSNTQGSSLIISSIVERVKLCLDDQDSIEDESCINGLYNVGIILNNLDTNFIRTNLKEADLRKLIDKLPNGSQKTKALFEKALKKM
jgi:hypothetical protein